MKLTLQKLMAMQVGYTFDFGETTLIRPQEKVMWIARKENGEGKWCIYYDFKDLENRGSRLIDLEIVKKLIDCTDNAIKRYKQ